MKRPVEVIEHLARSDHRVEVLEAISTGPQTRDEVRELVDASRVTVGRILSDLEERSWIERDGQEYVATERGRYVTTEFNRLVANLDAFDSLPAVTSWFPRDEPSFDLSQLDDATVINSDAADLIGPIRRSLDLIRTADSVRALANGASHEFIETMRSATETGATHELVLPGEAVFALQSDNELRPDMRAMLETDRFVLHSIEQELPVLLIADDTVSLCSGDHACMVETEDPEVYEWAETYFGSVKGTAEPVPADRFKRGPTALDGEAIVD